MAQSAPVVIAHRGASAYLPEHTLAAVAMAHAMKADFIEQDVVLTRDGEPVVLHDIHLDTTTDVARKFPQRARNDDRFYAIDFSLAEIRKLAAHERVDWRTGEAVYRQRFDPARAIFGVPTLEEEIGLIQGLNRSTGRQVGIYVEIKAPAWHRAQGQDISRIVLEKLNRLGYQGKEDNAIVESFDPREVRRLREELGSRLRLTQLIGENSWGEADTDFDALRSAAGIKTIAEYADGIGPWLPQVARATETEGACAEEKSGTPETELVPLAHRAGLFVHGYTLRKDDLPPNCDSFESALSMFIAAGVDGLFTDFPDLAVEHLQKHARPWHATDRASEAGTGR